MQRTSILAIDTSDSMKGARIAEAKKAALAYLATVPDNVKVGVVTFDDTVQGRSSRPTLDRAAATHRHRRAHADPQDRAVRRRARRAQGRRTRWRRRRASARSWCSPTARTPPTPSSPTSLDAIKKSGASVDVVSLQQGDEANQPLNAIAAAGKGTVLTTADPAALTAAFAKRGRRAGPPDRGDRQGAGRARAAPARTSRSPSRPAAEHVHRLGVRARCAAPPTSRPRRPQPRRRSR